MSWASPGTTSSYTYVLGTRFEAGNNQAVLYHQSNYGFQFSKHGHNMASLDIPQKNGRFHFSCPVSM